MPSPDGSGILLPPFEIKRSAAFGCKVFCFSKHIYKKAAKDTADSRKMLPND
jgi:hypothetical protein